MFDSLPHYHYIYSMPIQKSFYPKLVAALDKQRGYTDNISDDSIGQKSNLFRKLGTLAGAIYYDELKLSKTGFSQPDQIRVYTFNHNAKFAISPAEVLTSPPGTLAGIDETVAVPFKLDVPNIKNPEFDSCDTTWLVGYDIETQSYDDGGYDPVKDEHIKNTPPECVSHQWYFNFQGIRFGFIFLTKLRISQTEFVEFLDGTVPKIENPDILKNVKVYAHFSVYESGWMIAPPAKSKPDVKSKTAGKKKPPFALLINERNDEWCDLTELRTYQIAPPTHTPTGKICKAKPKEYSVHLEFGDSRKLQAGNLKNIGKTIGIEKKELPDGKIEIMAEFLTTNPKTFCEYAIIDSVITAEAHLYFFYKYKTCMLEPDKRDAAVDRMRMPGYSSDYFRGLYDTWYGDDWKKYLGYDDKGVMTLAHRAFVNFYHGGRNDVLSVGPRGEAHYLDLHSAYLTAVAMLDDYNFNRVRVTSGAAAEKRLDDLYNDGPFQVVGIECSFRFKDKGKPIFPVRIDEAESLPGVRINFNSDGIIYPKSGKSNLTMPEYWVAQKNDIIEKIIVHRVIEFVKVVDPKTKKHTQLFADEIIRLLKLRKDSNESDKLFYKNILNFFYGKTAQGVKATASTIKAHNFDKFVNLSSMTCYPLAAYITGFCRATVGELLQHNNCYAITTDGFITPVSRGKLVINDDDLCDRVQKKLKAGGFNKDFIGCDASGRRSLFIKTRGYLLLGNKPSSENDLFKKPPFKAKRITVKPGELSIQAVRSFYRLNKMAAMGAKVYKYTSANPIKDFLEILKKGYSDKKYFVKLNKIREEQREEQLNNPSQYKPSVVPAERLAKNVKTDMTFDMKHLPVNPTTENFEWNGFPYPFVSFETVPLDTATDYHILRALRSRDYTRDIPKDLLDPEYPFKYPSEFSTEELDAAYDYFEALKKNESQSAPAPPPTLLNTDAKPKKVKTDDKPKKVKTKKIGGVKMPQLIDFNIKADKKPLIELMLRSKSIPTYMVEPDYKRMLAKFDEYRKGEEELLQLPEGYTETEDGVENIPDEIERDVDSSDDMND